MILGDRIRNVISGYFGTVLYRVGAHYVTVEYDNGVGTELTHIFNLERI